MSSHTVAVLFDRIGPYHWARLTACQSLFSTVALELCSEDSTYQWNKLEAVPPFRRITIFGGVNKEKLTRREAANGLKAKLAEIAPSAVAIPGWTGKASLGALQWCQSTDTPAILMSESAKNDSPRDLIKEFVKRQIVGAFSAALVGGSRHAEYLCELGFPRERILLGYDAVDNAYFTAAAKKLRSDTSLLEETKNFSQPYFLASNRFVEKKNLNRLIEAYALYTKLSDSNPWPLVMLGDGPLRLELESLVSRLGLQGKVVFPGFKQYEELPAYYAFAGAFIHASTVEQWGLVVNEAMASGLPVLVSRNCGCVPELVEHGCNGFIFDPLDTQEMSQKMLKVATMSELQRHDMSIHSLKKINEWSPERFANSLKNCISIATKAGKRGSLLSRHLIRAHNL